MQWTGRATSGWVEGSRGTCAAERRVRLRGGTESWSIPYLVPHSDFEPMHKSAMTPTAHAGKSVQPFAALWLNRFASIVRPQSQKVEQGSSNHPSAVVLVQQAEDVHGAFTIRSQITEVKVRRRSFHAPPSSQHQRPALHHPACPVPTCHRVATTLSVDGPQHTQSYPPRTTTAPSLRQPTPAGRFPD